MVKLADTQDFRGRCKIYKFECTKGNLGCRTSLNGEDLTGNADVNAVPMLKPWDGSSPYEGSSVKTWIFGT